MTRLLQRPAIHAAPVEVPAPPAWDSVALAAYEQGHAEGSAAGREQGRRDHLIVGGEIDRCIAAVQASLAATNERLAQIAELFVTTTLRHCPDIRTAGLLVRLREVLDALDPGVITIHVHPDAVEATLATCDRRADHGGPAGSLGGSLGGEHAGGPGGSLGGGPAGSLGGGPGGSLGGGHRIVVTSDRRLATGEFRVTSEWADAEGTFERYIAAARAAIDLHLGRDVS
jgi:hypothetical protein